MLYTEVDSPINDFFQLRIYLSADLNEIKRSIYTIWDLLGDVGGLLEMLKLLASPLVTMFTLLSGAGLEKYIHESLFKVQRKSKPNSSFT